CPFGVHGPGGEVTAFLRDPQSGELGDDAMPGRHVRRSVHRDWQVFWQIDDYVAGCGMQQGIAESTAFPHKFSRNPARCRFYLRALTQIEQFDTATTGSD